MKIAILTFWWSGDNYGQQLQAFALQRFLRDKGHDAFLIRYNWEYDIKRSPLPVKIVKALNPVLLVKYVKGRKRLAKSRKEQAEHSRHFDSFRRKHIAFYPETYTSYDTLKNDPPDADAYIVGSDQVWNFYDLPLSKLRNMIHAYFLDFGSPSVKRISYAASWGKTEVPADIRNEIRPLIAKFNAVSVREKSGIDVCASCGRSGAAWCADPTLLLKAETYRTLYAAAGAQRPGNAYVFFYYVDNGGAFGKESVFRFAGTKGLEVVYVSGNMNFDRYEKTYASVAEWLSLLDGAEYVITNSFHCCVFSILFSKRFGAVRMNGLNEGMNSRLESLFGMTGCGVRYVAETDFSVLETAYTADISSCALGGEWLVRELERGLCRT